MQTFIDKRYRHICSDKNCQPLHQMEETPKYGREQLRERTTERYITLNEDRKNPKKPKNGTHTGNE